MYYQEQEDEQFFVKIEKPKMTHSQKSVWRSCTRKHRYKNFFTASKWGNEYGLRVYDCQVCRGYHLTKKEDNFYEKI